MTAHTPISERAQALDRLGFATEPAVLAEQDVAQLINALVQLDDNADLRAKGGHVYAVRNLLARVPAVREMAASQAVRSLVEPLLGARALVVRALLFDKTAGANWKVAWHQDLSIAVRRRIDVLGFGPWSMKAGVQHVQPPASMLQRMLTVRVHLDDCLEGNGPLLVLPGSHAQGVLSAAQVSDWRRKTPPHSCTIRAGGVLLMRPLLLHASSAASMPRHRRVIHLEYAAEDLPGGLQWAVA
jgi:ectoine hydroxylase-related dioxygenase (phytanoyl-CoA dioxygenase family)